MNYDVIIIGGGIIGFSTAMQLLERDKDLNVLVLEKEAGPAQHQTGHNSGVIHAGVYYKPGSLKAQFCLEGCRDSKEFCEKYNIPFYVPGKLIVAADTTELERMENLIERCLQNGLTVTKLTAAETAVRQPGIHSVGSFLVKESGIVNWKTVCETYAKLFSDAGGSIHYNSDVVSIEEKENSVRLKTKAGEEYTSNYLVTCSGLHSDRLVKLSGLNPDFKIIPFRGEYYQLSKAYNHYFNHLIYPVADPRLPFLGVHFTPQTSGITTVGPNAVLAFSREAYRWGQMNWKDFCEIVSFPPVWKLVANYFKVSCSEVYGSLSKRHYLKSIHKYFPTIKLEDITRYPAGVRAQAINNKGQFIEDFLFMESDRILHTCNAPSPGATSSLPIGKYIVNKFFEKL